MTSKITKSAVDAASASVKDQFVWDSDLKGFGLKVTPAGRKVYIVQYRLPGRTTRRFTIGAHGSPWTPAEARKEATRLLGQVAAGLDPAEEKKLARQDITVSTLCDIYLAEGAATKKQSTVDMDRSRIEAHVRPLLGSKRVKQLTKSDIRRFLTDIAEGKTGRPGNKGALLSKGERALQTEHSACLAQYWSLRSSVAIGPIIRLAASRSIAKDALPVSCRTKKYRASAMR